MVYQGDSYLLHATLANGTHIAMRGAVTGQSLSNLPTIGDQVTLSITPQDTVLIDGSEI